MLPICLASDLLKFVHFLDMEVTEPQSRHYKMILQAGVFAGFRDPIHGRAWEA